MVKKSQKLEMSQKIPKKSLRKKVLPRKEEINAILLVLLFEEFSIPPEPSSQPRFRFLGGYHECDKGEAAGWKSLCLM